MEKSDRNVARWVDERLGALDPAADFHPNPSAALTRLRARERRFRAIRRRWFWASAAAAAVCLMVLTAPMPCRAASASSCVQPVGARLWDSVFRKPVPAPAPSPAPVVAPIAMNSPEPLPAPPTAPAAARPEPGPAVPHPARPQDDAGPPAYKWEGSPNAPIVCEIYSDFQCPHCALASQEILPPLQAQFVQTGKVRVLHRDFPLTGHRYSRLAARYANAAGRAGVYDVVAQQLFRTQSEWGNDGDIESRLAPVLSTAVMRRIRDLVRDGAELDRSIDADVAMGVQDRIDRTPSLVVVFGGKRRVISGIPPFEMLKGYLDELRP